MELVFDGKTKSVYKLNDECYLLKFKDDATGEGGVFDPGSNKVGLVIEGMGRNSVRLSEYFFSKIEASGIHTHYIKADVENASMIVKKAVAFGKGLEVICRYRAVGSYIKRYGGYIEDGGELNGLVEFTLKDDAKNDPLITQDSLEALKILKQGEFELLKNLTKRISEIIKNEFSNKNAELYDIKIEFGKLSDGTIVLIDEISGGNMRVYHRGKKVGPLEISRLILEPFI